MANPNSSSYPPEDKDESEISNKFSKLPDVLVDQCYARIPRSYYRSLSRVCQLWQKQIHCESLYYTRRTLKAIDFSLFIKVRLPDKNKVFLSKWYEFFPMCNYRGMFKMPSRLPCLQLIGASVVSVGAKIYIIGGKENGIPTQTMFVYNLVSEQPELVESQMAVTRYKAYAGVFNNKIYFIGGCEINDPNWVEVFDLETRKWFSLTSLELCGVPKSLFLQACALVRGEIICFFFDSERMWMPVFVFDTSSSVWTEFPSKNYEYWGLSAPVVINEVFYCSIKDEIWGYDHRKSELKKLEFGEGVKRQFINVEKMVNMNDKLVVLWKLEFRKFWEFHCTVIEMRKDDESEVLLGFVVWDELIGQSAIGTQIVDCVAVGL